MKILDIKLTNYVGIMNGLGLNEIYIDFSRAMNKLCIIKGANRSGKSTLSKAISPIPDSNSSFIPKLEAKKELHILYEDIIYHIKITHSIKNNEDMDRDTTKAWITKSINGEIENLNPNGNISSYKDILDSEFGLDSNFMSLSQLSSDDRGLADKSPAQRKLFINSILENLSVYNNIYKTMSKRSSIFRSMINSLINKINKIGDDEQLKLNLSSIENRINKTLTDKDSVIERLASYKSKIEILDPDGSIQNTYNSIYNDMKDLDIRYKNNNINIDKSLALLYLDNDITLPIVIDNYKKINKEINSITTKIQLTESNITMLLRDREEESKSIGIKTERLNSLQSTRNLMDIESYISISKANIKHYMEIFNDMGISNVMNISKDEYIIGLNTLKEIKDIIDIFRADKDYETIQLAIEYISNNITPNIEKIENDIESLNLSIRTNEIEHQRYSTMKDISSKLKMRPTKCAIDDCQFIKDALDAFNNNPDGNLIEINGFLHHDNTSLMDKLKEKSNTISLYECINYLKSILRNVDKNASILNKLPIENIFSDKTILLDKIAKGGSFNSIDVMYTHIQHANVIEEYKIELDSLKSLEVEYDIYKSKSIVLNDITTDINILQTKLDKTVQDLNISNISLVESKRVIDDYKIKITRYDDLIQLFNSKDNMINIRNNLGSRFDVIKNNMVIIKECIDGIQRCNYDIDKLTIQIKPLMEDRDKLRHGIILSQDYKEELNIYSLKFDKIETIKKYSSPSKGIQNLFVEIYMNKMLSMANELLALLFDGEYILGNFVINEDEFRIPVLGSRIANDDISSMSTSQVCMISMILSFVLLMQSSSKYNILKLDEIDGGLDTENRRRFITVLDKLIDMMHIEQVILVSHNIEVNLDNCDIIALKDCGDIESGNIIYKY